MGYFDDMEQIEVPQESIWAGVVGEMLKGTIVGTRDGKYGTLYTVQLNAPTRLTLNRRGGEKEEVEFQAGDVVILPTHANLNAQIESFHLGIHDAIGVECVGTYEVEYNGKMSTGMSYHVYVKKGKTGTGARPAGNGGAASGKK